MTTQNIFDLVDTWALSGGPYTSIKMNATDNDAASASLLMDLQVGSTSWFNVGKSGLIQAPNAIRYSALYGYTTAAAVRADTTSLRNFTADVSGVRVSSASSYGFTSASDAAGTADLILTRRAAANLRLGAADAAAPVAQTLSVQSVVAGTTNTAGTNLTITGSQGTGTGAGGSIIFQVAAAGSSGSAQNALSTALSISSNGSLGNIGYLAVQPSGFTNASILDNSGNIQTVSGGAITFASSATNAGASIDTTIKRGGAAGVILLGNSTTPTDFSRLQFGGTSASFPAIKRSSTTLQARLADDSAFAPVQGKLTTDTAYTAGAIVVTGYLTLYDSTGTAYRVPCVV